MPLLSPFHITAVNGATVLEQDGAYTLSDPAIDGRYTNAQITDYDYQTFDFRWNPPLRLSLTAYASGGGESLRGTAGFGFWNHPFSPDSKRFPRLPQAAWFFFGSPPNDMRLALDVPGHGWKAAALDMARPRALAWIPAAPLAVLLMQNQALYRRVWPPIQRALAIAEHSLDPALLAEPHTYTLDWRADGLMFGIDGKTVFTTDQAPRGPLGFIAWIDNQFAVVTPQARLGGGILPLAAPQSLTVGEITITGLE